MLLTLGVSHKTAPIEIREKMAFSLEHIPKALKAFAKELSLEEVALLSTCNRTEFYCSTRLFEKDAMQSMVAWWQKNRAVNFELSPFIYSYANLDAVKHMMRVASGLDSMVIGEPQILGQLKTAFGLATEMGVVGKRLSRLFQTTFAIAKKVRTDTGISNNPVSIAYAAVNLAKQIFTDLSQTTVLLLGAGENTELTLQHLKAKNVKKIVIANRTLLHAQNLANQYGAKAVPLSEINQHLSKTDIVISAMGAPNAILTQEHVHYTFANVKRRPVLMVDLGVPRNIEPNVGNHEDIYLYTVDDLNGIISKNLKFRENAAIDAEGIIMKASQDYQAHLDENPLLAVKDLRERAKTIKDEALNRALIRLENGEPPELVLRQFAHSLTQRLMHEPTLQIKDLFLNTQAKSEKVS